ncbi:hypothetical protein GW793_03820 [bacterium]|nr:hypothetical protein [bacterium]
MPGLPEIVDQFSNLMMVAYAVIYWLQNEPKKQRVILIIIVGNVFDIVAPITGNSFAMFIGNGLGLISSAVFMTFLIWNMVKNK